MALTTIEQGLSFVQYEADGTTPNFPLTFQYLQQADVKVFVGNTEVFYTWLNAATVTPNTLPSVGDIVTVRRFTTNTERLVDFQDGGQISERDLDKDSNQLFFLTQESNDTAAFNLTIDPLLQVVDFEGNRGINLAAPIDPTDAINKQYIDTIESSVTSAVDTANAASAAANAISDVADAAFLAASTAETNIDLHLTDDTAHDASAIVNTPAGEVSAITVQAAINELDTEKQSRSEKGQINGYAELDSNGKVPAGQLPSFVDDVLEFTDLATFPVTGEVGKIYVAIDTSKAYRWSGTVYTEISPSEVNSVNGQTGAVVLDKADVGLDQVDNTSDATKNAAVANLTNKALISPSRLDPKKDTLANLLTYASMTGMNGELVYSTDTKEFFVITDNDLVAAGGGSGDNTSLLINPSFEGREEEWTCVNATGAMVPTTLPSANSEKMFQMTVSTIGGYCDFVAPTGVTAEGLLFKIGGLFQTSLTGVEYCSLVNGTVDNCIPINSSTKFTQPLATQSIAGATSVGVRVRSTTVTGVVNVDKLHLSMGGLPTGPTVSCDGDLDCENTFSAKVSSTAVISDSNIPSWLTSCSIISTSVFECVFAVGLFTETPNCFVTAYDDLNFYADRKITPAETNSTKVRYVTQYITASGSGGGNRGSTLTCQKAAPDFKPITQQGVVNVGTAQGAQVRAVVTGGQSIGTSATVFTLGVADIGELKGFSFDDGNDEFTALQAGKYAFNLNGTITNTTNNQTTEVVVQVDDGGGYVSRSICDRPRTVTAASAITKMNCIDAVFLNRGDKVRFSMISNAAGTTLNSLTSSVLLIRSVIDQQTIAASMIDRKIYDGNEYLAGEIAVVGGIDKPAYRRCYELTSNIDTTTTIATIPTGLNPVEWLPYLRATRDRFYQDVVSASGSNYATISYVRSTGVLNCEVGSTTYSCNAGARFCFKYTY